jgi:hypothetical protein
MMIVLTITPRHQLIFNVSGIRIQIPYRQQETLLVELTGTHFAIGFDPTGFSLAKF